MTQTAEHSLQYGSTTIAYQLSYTDRGTLAIHVHPDTRVTVEAPLDSELAEIEKRIRKRAAWIVRQQRNFRRYSPDFPPRQYVSGESHRYLGQQYRLKVLQNEEGKENVRLDREFLTVYTRKKGDQRHTKALVESWYRQQALALFAERIAFWFPHFERLGAKQPQVTTRHMRSRWGSCTAKGKITFNTKLLMVHKHLIDYVVVHEMCHLLEHHHGLQFQQLLTRILPDWKERKEKLDHFDFG